MDDDGGRDVFWLGQTIVYVAGFIAQPSNINVSFRDLSC
jgi:hypothetical protein